VTQHRVPAPPADEWGSKGPQSYFASIERTYGRPIQDWLDLAADGLLAGRTHMEVVAGLKREHGLGHGHANAVVADARAKLA